MARPQGTPRGMIAKERIDVGSQQMTYNSTALVLSGGVKISNRLTLTANSSGVTAAGGVAALPGNVATGTFAIGTNSTGANFIAVRTTGTTWKYLNVTTALPS